MHMFHKSRADDASLACLFFPLLIILCWLVPGAAYAQNSNVAQVLCTIYDWLSGPLGQVIGALAVVATSLMAMFGRIQLPTVLVTMAGLALIFGAQEIVNALGLTANCSGVGATTAPNIINSPIYKIFSCLHGFIGGPMGKSLGTLAIIMLGVFAMYGKISYQQALIVCSGIAGMFGAYSVIENLSFTVSGGAKLSAVAVCGPSNPLSNAYCSVVNWFNGPFGKALATISIIILGLGALYGKVSWGLAIIAGIGVSLIFGGTTIVAALGGPSSLDCAAAATGESLYITGALCNIINWANGPVGKGVATLAVIILGLGALFGKVSWTMTVVGVTGVALLFGATNIVSGLGGPGQMGCPKGSMLNLKTAAAGASTSSGGGGSSSSSGASSSTGGGYQPGQSINLGGGNSMVYPGTSVQQTNGSITINGTTVDIPVGTLPGVATPLSNGWVITLPDGTTDGTLVIPAAGPPPLVDQVIVIPHP